MSKNWLRRTEIIVGGKSFNMRDFNISFSVKFDSTETPNTAEISIDNLTASTLAEHFQKGKPCIINAGYDGDVGTLFAGFVTDVSNAKENGTKTTKILAFDANDLYMKTFISKSYYEGIYALEIIEDLLRQVGLKAGEITLAKNLQYPNGRAVMGKIRDVLKEIVENDCETGLQITNGAMVIRNIGVGIQTGVILTPQTGLISSPERVQTDSVEITADFKAKSLLNYKISALSAVRLESEEFSGDLVVLSGSHTGSNTGDFTTETELKII
jgi:hypothetical protein